jgi:hypothetical protein
LSRTTLDPDGRERGMRILPWCAKDCWYIAIDL